MKRIRYIAEYFLILTLRLALSLIPEKFVPAFADALAWILHRMIPYRKKVFYKNIRIAFPDYSMEEIELLLKKTYRHLVLLILEMIRLFTWDDQQLNQMVDLSQILPYRDSIRKGSILLSGHVGSWEIFARALCLNGFPLSVIMKRQKNPFVNRLIEKWRNEVGMDIIYTRGAFQKSLDELRKGKMITILGDQDARSKGVFVPFFNRMASTHTGAALLSWLYPELPVLLGAGIRNDYGNYRAVIKHLDTGRLRLECRGDRERYIHLFLYEYHQFLEQVIRSYPEQYFWFHKRWKTNRPDEEKVDYHAD